MEYSKELAIDICSRIAEGESLTKICQEKNMPSKGLFLKWVLKAESGDEKYIALRDQYARAMSVRTELMREEIMEIADDGTNDWMKNEKGEDVLNHEHVQRSKLRIDTRKWLMSKLEPKKYSEKLQIGGSDALTPLQVTFIDNVNAAD